jgi:molecular chaperone GrpE
MTNDDPKDSDPDQAGPPPAGEADSTAGVRDPEPELEIEVEGAAGPAARVAELETKQKETHDRLLRALADLENHRRRSRKDLEDARLEAQGRVLREMLPVVDNLERAMAHAGKTQPDAGVVEGVRLVLRQFAQAFERCGVSAIVAEGQPFDPNLHEAVSQAERGDVPPGTIVEVLQTGYRLGERLLRPTLAVVSRRPSAPTADDAGTPEA